MTHLLEINTRVWLKEQPWAARTPDLALIPDGLLERWRELGFDWIWFMGVWEPSPESRRICLEHKELMQAFRAFYPEAIPRVVVGSPYAVRSYTLNPALGAPGAVQRLRERMHRHGLRLMLDFVPNHTALDHEWADSHPEYYVRGTEADLREKPWSYFKTPGGAVIAHGKDPYFAPWTDTAQINYAIPAAREACVQQMIELAAVCDGLRCDMAMLVTNEVFARTWQTSPPMPDFWPGAIRRVRSQSPGFFLMAEVYWDMEWALQEMGFDFTYDKRLYDRLVEGNGQGIREHLHGGSAEYQSRLVRFIENHDEPRARETFGERVRAAALLSAALPGMMMHHDGQWEGRRKKVPVQLDEQPAEAPDEELRGWHERMMMALQTEAWRTGQSRCLNVCPISPQDSTHENIIAIHRESANAHGIAVVNVGSSPAKGCLKLEGIFPESPFLEFRDAISETVYFRSRSELAEAGLCLDLSLGEAHLFGVEPSEGGGRA